MHLIKNWAGPHRIKAVVLSTIFVLSLPCLIFLVCAAFSHHYSAYRANKFCDQIYDGQKLEEVNKLLINSSVDKVIRPKRAEPDKVIIAMFRTFMPASHDCMIDFKSDRVVHKEVGYFD
jgi:hypothetical protein